MFGIIFIAIPDKVANILPYMIIGMLLARAISFFIKGIKAERKLEKVSRFVNSVMSIVLGVLIFIMTDKQKEMIAIVMIIHTVIEIGECTYALIINRKDKQQLIVNILNIVAYVILLVELIIEFAHSMQTHVVIYETLFLIQGIVGIIASLKNFNGKNSLGQIILKSHTLEIIAWLFVVTVGASILLPIFEIGITNFGDGLWYCYMLMTTIGLGDLTVVTPAGRLISVIVGIYGIIVFALITSILVNLYNENKAREQKSQKDNDEHLGLF